MARLGGVSVNRPAWRCEDEPAASRMARIRTTCRSKPGRSPLPRPLRRGRDEEYRQRATLLHTGRSPHKITCARHVAAW